MEFNFDWNCVAAGAPYITISEIALGFNTPSISLLGNPENVIVGFDEKKLIIGIKKYNGEVGIKAYKFYSRIRDGWIRIGCKDFIRYLSSLTGYKFNPAKRFIANFNVEDKLLYISLKEDNQNVAETTDNV